jgi:hypothetical protein
MALNIQDTFDIALHCVSVILCIPNKIDGLRVAPAMSRQSTTGRCGAGNTETPLTTVAYEGGNDG